MADKSGIEWTDATWNPLAGCTPVSPGCTHCYAATMARRLAAMGQRKYAGTAERRGTLDVFTGKINLGTDGELSKPLHWQKPRRVFVNSMSDLFHEAVPFEFVGKVWAAMFFTPQHTYQVLTKRPERAATFLGEKWIDYPHFVGPTISTDSDVQKWCDEHGVDRKHRERLLDVMIERGGFLYDWPLANVWIGTSVEDQKRADERIPHLLRCPAAVRFLSIEPLLGPVELGLVEKWLGIDWVIVGGESGKDARPMHPDWLRSLRDQCAAAGVPFFFKQWGEWAPRDVVPGGDLGGDFRRGNADIVKPFGEPDGHFRRGDALMGRVGKKAAGRLLDGIEHNGFPVVEAHV